MDPRRWCSGDAWLLYLERNVWHAFFRDRFFPDLSLRVAPRLARIGNGRVVERHAVLEAKEDRAATVPGGECTEGVTFDGPVPTWATLHAAFDGRLYVLWRLTSSEGLHVRLLLPEIGPATLLPLQAPLSTFQAACPRNGCAPSNIVDLYGVVQRLRTSAEFASELAAAADEMAQTLQGSLPLPEDYPAL